jgi:signal transduction histidine kinase/CheY-like chemotaxis protein
MVAVASVHLDRPVPLRFSSNLIVAIAAFVVGGFALHRYGGSNPILHTMLDTSSAVTAALVAMMFWDASRRLNQTWLLLLAISFGWLAAAECTHAMAALIWTRSGGQPASAEILWRAGTWGAPAHLLPLGVGAALLLRDRPRSFAWLFAIALGLVALLTAFAFLSLPRYAPPGLLGITRPTLVLVPFLWVGIVVAYWRQVHESELARTVAVAAVALAAAHFAMLYSRAPSDAMALVAHLGKFIGDALLLTSLAQIGAADSKRLRLAEHELTALNRDLDVRVKERTARLQEVNGRMHLLQQITHAMGERQDVLSIFHTVASTLEKRMPADFVCLCLYDRVSRELSVNHVGARSAWLARALEMSEHAIVPIDENGLSRCVRGELVYEPDIAAIGFPFPKRLAAQGIRSLVLAPLKAKTQVFGVLIVARLARSAFLSTDCEFLHLLGEHVALAAHEAEIRTRLQLAYDDLRRTQQSVLQHERLRAIGQMASGITHDINNAISPVAVYTKAMLEKEPNLSPRMREYLELVGRVVKDISATVGRLRDFYRRDQTDVELKPLNLNDLVPQVVDLTRARWSDMPQQHGVVVTVETDLEPDLPPVMGDETELREALTNLVFNAVDAMPQGGVLTLRTRGVARQSGRHWVQLEVGDTGVGMDEATRKRCLEPFFTTKGERGTGLGLAMVFGAVRRHGAALDIDSSPGAGTRVRIEFTATEADAPRIVDRGPKTDHPLRLLLVDDDPAVLSSTQTVLEMDGHDVAVAEGGQAAADALAAALKDGKSFDIVVTDLGMPHLDGQFVARTVKELFPATPVVMLTGWGRRLPGGEEQARHVDFILSKPVDIDELRDLFTKITSSAALK